MTAEVEVEAVTRRFGAFTALHSVNLRIEAGRFVVLLGPSGCGKTTLLSILGGFLAPTEGCVRLGGLDVTALPPSRRRTTTVFQDYALFPHMSLGANVGFGLRMRGIRRAARDERSRVMLELVGLHDAFGKRPHQLSGGQRQRVALARALAVEPDVLLLDEPLGALDLKLRRQMQDELKAIQRRVGTTFVHVTHDQEEAMAIADEIVVMEAGRIRDEGTPEAVYLAPRCHFSAAFMGEANFVAGTVRRAGDDGFTVDTARGALRLPSTAAGRRVIAVGDRVEVCFRPEHVDMSATAADALHLGQVSVSDIAFFGTHHRCRLLPVEGEGEFIAHFPQSANVSNGGRLELCLNAERATLIPEREE